MMAPKYSLIEYVPLKQGLRPFLRSIIFLINFMLIEYVPLKQGLRLVCHQSIWLLRNDLIEYVPLKQGLRHGAITFDDGTEKSHRVCSIKTRIKTSREKFIEGNFFPS